jgi:tRNA-splicing ligase RtcB
LSIRSSRARPGKLKLSDHINKWRGRNSEQLEAATITLTCFTDEQDRVWIGVHFGSRGLGHKTATWFLKKAGAKDGMDVEPCVIGANADLGVQYIEAMHLAGEYAYAGRDWVCSRIARLLGATILEEVHNHHNFAWRENHDGEDLWVVRKGATPAFPGQKVSSVEPWARLR